MGSLVITVILNTNRREDTLEVLDSLSKSDYPDQHTIVLDNSSTDGSVEAIREVYPAIEIIRLGKNLGYAGNNNVGIKAAMERKADWVFVLNEDTILAPDCLSKLIEAGESNPRIGIVGPMVYHHNEPGVIQSAGGRMDQDWRAWHEGQNQSDRGQYPYPRQVEWISGCAILVRRGVIDQVGSLDERFFYYFEETEWCLRAREKGWQIWQIPGARLWHKGVQRDYKPSPNVTYYNTRNRLLMLSKHNAPLRAWVVAWGKMLSILSSWSIRPKWRNMREHRNAMWQGMLDFVHHQWGMRKI
jgi:GT2 family glycosyltransferase